MSDFFSNSLIYMEANPIFAYSIILMYGLFFGSFLNVVIYRLPIMMNNEYLSIIGDITGLSDETITSKMTELEKKEYTEMRAMKDLNLAFPHSRCSSCGKKLSIWQNIPILSYLILRGKCYHCKTSYSPAYLFFELFVGLFWCFSYFTFGLTWDFILIASLFTGLIASAAIDLKYRILPDSITIAGLFMGLYYNTVILDSVVTASGAIEGALAGYLGTYMFVKGYEKIRGLDIAMGEGDLKLYGLCGAWVGITDLVFLIVLSTVIGVLQFIILVPFKNKLSEYQLPFGPAIILSLFIFIFFGNVVTSFLS